MSYEFTKLSEVEFAEQPSTEANILIEDNGNIKRTLLSNVGGSGVGVETINFTLAPSYGLINEIELVEQAFENNMTFHLILQSDLTEDSDGMSCTHVSFPRVKDFSLTDEQQYLYATTVPIWIPSEEKFVKVQAGFMFELGADPHAMVMAASGSGVNPKIKACYATTV